MNTKLFAIAAGALFLAGPAFAGDNVPGRNNPHSGIVASAHGSKNAASLTQTRDLSLRDDDQPGRKQPRVFGRASGKTYGFSAPAVTERDAMRDVTDSNDDQPGRRQPS